MASRVSLCWCGELGPYFSNYWEASPQALPREYWSCWYVYQWCFLINILTLLFVTFTGAFSLYQKQKELPKPEQYVWYTGTINLPKHNTFTIIICMLPAMSHVLLKTKCPTLDTLFKRAAGYQEFEIEVWFPSFMKCTCNLAHIYYKFLTHVHLAVVCCMHLQLLRWPLLILCSFT